MAGVVTSKLLRNGIKTFWIEGKLDATAYKKLLQYRVFPVLRKELGPNFSKAYWIEDGAPPHHSRKVSNYLN